MNLRSLKLKYRNREKNCKVLTKFEKGITKLSATHSPCETEPVREREMPVDSNVGHHAINASKRLYR
jgi:hypothetical protein